MDSNDEIFSECVMESNPCDQVCYLIGLDTTICDCHPGYALLPDGQTCRGASIRGEILQSLSDATSETFKKMEK